MQKFFSSLRRLWAEAKKRRRYADIINPARIGNMARELAHLVEIALSNGHIPYDEAHYLHNLHKEMEKLIDLTQKNAFRKLPADRRVTLYHSLRRSHKKLLTTIQNTDAPTTRLQ